MKKVIRVVKERINSGHVVLFIILFVFITGFFGYYDYIEQEHEWILILIGLLFWIFLIDWLYMRWKEYREEKKQETKS